MSDEEQSNSVAGHLPAVKAGGMRIVQHKNPNPESPAKDSEDCTGLTQQSSVNSNIVSGVHSKGIIYHTPQEAQVAHVPPPPVHVRNKPRTIIQQPRK